MEGQSKQKNPLRIIIRVTIFVFIILLLTYIALKTAAVYDPDTDRRVLLNDTVIRIESIAVLAWEFLKPLLQLVFILFVVEWLLSKFGISLSKGETKLEWNVQTIIALVIVVSFALAALSGIPGVGVLKDLALVVIGFYFGTQRKLNDQKNTSENL